MNLYRYRKVLYQDYFVTQSGRGVEEALEAKLAAEKDQLEQEIIPLLPKDRSVKILDIGCGYGSLIYYLKKQGYQNLSGIDVSEGQVKVAHELGITEVMQGDLISFLLEHKNSFDVILGIDIIEHFSKDELVDLISLIHEALTPEGMALFRTPNLDAPFASIFANGDFTHENFLNAYSANQVFTSCGFSHVEVIASHLQVQGFLKEIIRKIVWAGFVFFARLLLFASARSSRYVLFSPNMLIRTRK